VQKVKDRSNLGQGNQQNFISLKLEHSLFFSHDIITENWILIFMMVVVLIG
jgi:hypothetical protein